MSKVQVIAEVVPSKVYINITLNTKPTDQKGAKKIRRPNYTKLK